MNAVRYHTEQRVWILNPYPRTRLRKKDARRQQGPPPYDDDSGYRSAWLSPRVFLRPVWVPAKVVSVDAAESTCVCVTTGLEPAMEVMMDCSADDSRPLPMNTSTEPFDDLVDLPHLHAAALLHNIQNRFGRDQIYTYAGPILLAVNPYQYITLDAPAWSRVKRLAGPAAQSISRSGAPVDIYHPLVQDLYARQKPSLGASSSMLPPHVFQVAKVAFDRLVDVASPEPQSIVISGESGAGKTATTKLVLNFIAEASALKRRTPSRKGAAARERRMSSAAVAPKAPGKGARRVSVVTNDFAVEGMSTVSTRILQSNHILEAFGNAKTVRNDNSSRFGKLIKVFLAPAGEIVGATMESYLLEKVRVVSQSAGERNFHVFYMVLAGLSAGERTKYQLLPLDEYRYLTLSDVRAVDGVDDALEFTKMRDAMTGAFALTPDAFDEVMRLIRSVVHFFCLHHLFFCCAQHYSLFASSAVCSPSATSPSRGTRSRTAPTRRPSSAPRSALESRRRPSRAACALRYRTRLTAIRGSRSCESGAPRTPPARATRWPRWCTSFCSRDSSRSSTRASRRPGRRVRHRSLRPVSPALSSCFVLLASRGSLLTLPYLTSHPPPPPPPRAPPRRWR
jgi:hypothetical protein